MPIQILSPQLANQIAAGEVVERPASVVKELVENSLDAGATRIQIDIENGGSRLIRIRDNGIGIAKEELELALARHATSKIANLEDLEAILSLGFRGEALASISSVSRLTLTSRPEDQTEAWQVYAQGREMDTTIQPASHPKGTTVEVANLFFNTPARRKFLRSEKTEFSHIDEVIRRIALAKPNIALTLTHNRKTVRQYKPAQTAEQKLKRVGAICGEEFIRHALQIDWKHDDLHLYGWVALPQFVRAQNDLAYCYINGRMVRDKIINHAIRQAYGEYLSSDQYPAFVLFLDLNPQEVDVNVHPTKHEVRFHQQRLIHDFIYQGIYNALSTEQHLPFNDEVNHVKETTPTWNVQPNRAAAGQNIFAPNFSSSVSQPSNNSGKLRHSSNYTKSWQYTQPHISQIEQHAYADLLKSSESVESHLHETNVSQACHENFYKTDRTLPPSIQANRLRSLAIIEQNVLLLQRDEQFYLLSLTKLQKLKYAIELRADNTQPLLIPIAFHLTDTQHQVWQATQQEFAEIGFDLNYSNGKLTVYKVPACLRQQNLQQIILTRLNQPKNLDFRTALLDLLEWNKLWVLADAVNLLTEVEQLLMQNASITKLEDLLCPIDWQPFLQKL